MSMAMESTAVRNSLFCCDLGTADCLSWKSLLVWCSASKTDRCCGIDKGGKVFHVVAWTDLGWFKRRTLWQLVTASELSVFVLDTMVFKDAMQARFWVCRIMFYVLSRSLLKGVGKIVRLTWYIARKCKRFSSLVFDVYTLFTIYSYTTLGPTVATNYR